MKFPCEGFYCGDGFVGGGKDCGNIDCNYCKEPWNNMTHPNKIKGNLFERKIVDTFKQIHGIEVNRTWGSNGKSQGLSEEVDVVVNYPGVWQEPLYVQCKSIKALPLWLGMSENIGAVVFKENRGKAYIMLPLDDFIWKYMRQSK